MGIAWLCQDWFQQWYWRKYLPVSVCLLLLWGFFTKSYSLRNFLAILLNITCPSGSQFFWLYSRCALGSMIRLSIFDLKWFQKGQGKKANFAVLEQTGQGSDYLYGLQLLICAGLVLFRRVDSKWPPSSLRGLYSSDMFDFMISSWVLPFSIRLFFLFQMKCFPLIDSWLWTLLNRNGGRTRCWPVHTWRSTPSCCIFFYQWTLSHISKLPLTVFLLWWWIFATVCCHNRWPRTTISFAL